MTARHVDRLLGRPSPLLTAQNQDDADLVPPVSYLMPDVTDENDVNDDSHIDHSSSINHAQPQDVAQAMHASEGVNFVQKFLVTKSPRDHTNLAELHSINQRFMLGRLSAKTFVTGCGTLSTLKERNEDRAFGQVRAAPFQTGCIILEERCRHATSLELMDWKALVY
ncbi:hypothetical protein BGZ65_012263 [Modicella reniformis]|uniref:Uncharacterized protein n=1 Tax=Modicella reniformis TaxID=1440133 RepID=A0A9P6MJJ4_9FUNG|nr:hypothetical protein BGZ65_012263 [Modicella reniformis]